MTYEEAARALDVLDGIGVRGGEAYRNAVQEIADALGDDDFMKKIGYGQMGYVQRARDLDSMMEQKNQKKSAPVSNSFAPQAPMSASEFDKLRAMYEAQQ